MDAPLASKDEIQREMESIRSMRRISSQSGPGSLPLDPDLPPSPGTTTHGDLIPSPTIGDDDTVIPSSSGAGGAFFWVPASLHPELAPSEFKAFLRDHRRDSEEGGDASSASLGRVGSIGLQRSPSGLSRSSSGLGRQKSMLSRQYQPKEGDDLDRGDEEVKPIRRNRGSIYANVEPQLTIKDLQKLDDLASAAEAGDGSEAKLIRSQLRRSISLGFTESILNQIDAIPENEEDAPVIVPQKALQRTARTRIRKPGLEGDGGGHRFASSRRGKRNKTLDSSSASHENISIPHMDDSYGRPTSDVTSDRASLSDQEGEPYARPSAPSPEPLEDSENRPRFAGTREEDAKRESTGESIYDAYATGDGDQRESIYYDARESGSFDRNRPSTEPISRDRVLSGGSVDLGKGARNGVVYEDDDEPFFAGAGATSPTSPEKEAPTVILRPHSPERAPETLPLTLPKPTPPQLQRTESSQSIPPTRPSMGERERSGEMPVNAYGQQQHLAQSSTNRSFIKEYGYQAQYSQPLPPSQMYRDSSTSQIVQPTPKKHLDVPNTAVPAISPPVSPEPRRVSPTNEPYDRPYSAPPTSTSGRPSSADKKMEKEKDKGKSRGFFGWSGSGKDKDKGEKAKKEKEKEKEKERERELLKKKEKNESKVSLREEEKKETGGGLFGIFGGKKKHDDASSNQSHTSQAGQKQAVAQKHLGPFTPTNILPGQYARYPLHVERAVYRLSHIKLANPRRPLYEQVLISNLMFWYLGIINKPVTPVTPPSEQMKLAAEGGNAPVNEDGQPIMTTQMSPAQQAAAAQAAAAEKARLEQEQREREARELAEQREREQLERERQEQIERERREREAAAQQRETRPKKTGLTKPERGGERKAEMAVRGANYSAQSQSMDDHAWEQVRDSPSGRPSTSPAGSKPASSPAVPAYHLPGRVQARPNPAPQQPYFYQQDMNQVAYQPMNPYALPPGAKPPAAVENSWAVSSSQSAGRERAPSRSPPPGGYHSTPSGAAATDRPRPTRSPPPHDYLSAGIPSTGMPNGARPARSLSASGTGNRPSPTSSPSFPPSDYDRPPNQYSQGSNVPNGTSSGKLQKKKSSSKVKPDPSPPAPDLPATSPTSPNDGKPTARRRKSMETGGGDRRGIIEPEVPFEQLWQQQYGGGGYSSGYPQAPQGYQQPAHAQGQQGWNYR